MSKQHKALNLLFASFINFNIKLLSKENSFHYIIRFIIRDNETSIEYLDSKSLIEMSLNYIYDKFVKRFHVENLNI